MYRPGVIKKAVILSAWLRSVHHTSPLPTKRCAKWALTNCQPEIKPHF